MKKLFILLLVIVALVGGGILLLPKLVPMERVAVMVKEQVRQATGRDMDFKGASFTFWPNLGVELKNVTLSNPAWAKEKNMLTIERANVALALRPLLQRRIEIKRFVLEAPVIHLESSPDGKKSWDFSKGKAGTPEPQENADSAATPSGYALKFDELLIKNSKLTYDDHKGITSLDDIDLTISLPDLKSALKLDGKLTYKQKRVDLALGVEKPMEFIQGGTSPGSAQLKTADITVKASGTLATQGEMLNGNVEADITSLADFLAWIGNGQKQKLPFTKVSFSSPVRASKTDIVMKGADLALDDVHAKGNLNIGLMGKPDIFARLSLGNLNLDRFTGGDAAPVAAGAGQTGEPWDSTPIDMSGLKAVNADMELKTEGFTLKGVDVGPSVLSVALQDGTLRFRSSEAALFGGKFSSSMNLSAAAMALTFDMKDVQAKPVLATFADFNKLSGTADAHVSVTSSGNSQKALVSNLNGSGSVIFQKGSLEGIDLANIAQMVQNRLTNVGIGEGKTDFVDLGGTFTVSKGIASNNDLKMRGPLVQATGKGTIDLPQKYIQYRVIPVLTASSAVPNAGGIAVPVDIKGSFSNIKIKPDYASMVQEAIKDPEAMKKNIKEQGKALKENFKDIKDLKQDPLKALQGLLGGGAPAVEPPPAQPNAPSVLPPSSPPAP